MVDNWIDMDDVADNSQFDKAVDRNYYTADYKDIDNTADYQDYKEFENYLG